MHRLIDHFVLAWLMYLVITDESAPWFLAFVAGAVFYSLFLQWLDDLIRSKRNGNHDSAQGL
jgi:hypothetical protein